MQRENISERGQVLVIIALVMFGLVGISGLAIDGSRAYSDRRQAQNAADTAAMAAALSYIRNEDVNLMKEVSKSRAASNGYNNNGSTNTVEVNYPPDEHAPDPYVGNDEYVQIIITSHLGTLLGRVVGIEQVTNTVQAVARLTPSKNESMFGGNALVSLNKTACSSLNYQGGASLTVKGSGIFSNSNCTSTSNGAFNTNTGSGSVNVPCLTSVGTITTGTNTKLNTNGCQHSEDESLQVEDPYAIFPFPNRTACDTTLAKIQPDGVTMSPGYYSGAFPPTNNIKYLQPGVYCLDTKNHGFTLNGGQELTGNGVVIIMLSGVVSWNSGAVHLTAPTTEPYPGLLLSMSYENPKNCSDVTLNGNGTSTFVGSILAPCSNVKLNGGSGGSGYNNQIIADTITLSGNTDIVINFDPNKQWKPPTYPTVELIH